MHIAHIFNIVCTVYITQYTAEANFRFALILTVASKKEFCYSKEKALRNLVALLTTTTSIVIKVWNNQLNQPPFLSFFSFIIRHLNFVTFYFFSINHKQNKKNNFD